MAIRHLSEDLGTALAKAIGKVSAKSIDLDFDTIRQEYCRIEAFYLSKFRGDEFRTVETKRRIAEVIFTAAVGKARPVPECRALFRKLCKLGFSNVSDRTMFYIIYARCMGWGGNNSEGIRVLCSLLKMLDSERLSPTVIKRWRKEIIEVIEDLAS